MPRQWLIGIAFAVLTACETVPPTMDAAVFDAEITQLDSNPSIAAAEVGFERLLARTDLTELQRAEVLFLRAEQRLDHRFNLPQAVEDFDQFAVLQPEDPRAATSKRRVLFAQAEISAAQRRLAQLQNLSDWFDDKVLMGDLDVAAGRYKDAGLTPNPAQLYLLREAGFVCEQSALPGAQPVQVYGEPREDTVEAVWCEGPSLS
ncbi:MAG: hypothetical protein AAFV59_06895 [Pseudomonadota bacterium]